MHYLFAADGTAKATLPEELEHKAQQQQQQQQQSTTTQVKSLDIAGVFHRARASLSEQAITMYS